MRRGRGAVLSDASSDMIQTVVPGTLKVYEHSLILRRAGMKIHTHSSEFSYTFNVHFHKNVEVGAVVIAA